MRLLPTKRSVFCGERQKRRQPSTCSVKRSGSQWMLQTSGCIPLGRRETMALKNQSVVDKWNTLVLNGAGRATHVLQTIDKKIQGVIVKSCVRRAHAASCSTRMPSLKAVPFITSV